MNSPLSVLKFCLTIILANMILCLFAFNLSANNSSVPFIDDPTACDLTVTVNPDAHICDPEDFELEGEIDGDFDSFVWCENGSPTSYDLEETVELTGPTSFTLKAFFQSEVNSIVNGDFESGDSDFTTDYTQGNGNCTHGAGFLGCEGSYEVMDNPNDGHTAFDPCSDNGGGGNMMVVNGAASLQEIWCQTVCVEPDKDYVFSAYATSVNPGSPAILQFSIDGDLIGSSFGLSGTTCDWEYFEELWESSGATTVEICVTNQNTAAGGNDFALDDIGFFQICEEESSFDVTISDFFISIEQPIDLDCINEEIEINIEVEPFDTYDIIWDTGDGDIEETLIDGYSILVSSPGTYIVTVIDQMGCEREEEVSVYQEIEEPELELTKSGDIDCINSEVEIMVDANMGGLDFTWTDSNGDFISDDEEFFVTVGDTYTVLAYDPDTGCEKTEEITVIEDSTSPDFDIISTNDLNCAQDFTIIYTDTAYDLVNWIAINQNLSFPTEDSLIISVPGLYEATVMLPNGCFHKDTVEVSEVIPIFDYQFSFDGNIDCNTPGSEISLTYNGDLFDIDWETLPVAYNDSTAFTLFDEGKYIFTLTDTFGCSKIDSVEISGNFAQPLANAAATEIDCNTPFATLNISDPNGQFEIEWTDESGNIYNGDQIDVSQGGVVNYTITSTNGCTSANSITVEASDEFPIVGIAGDNLDCTQLEVTLAADADQNNIAFTWELPDGSIQTGAELTVSEAGIYLVSGENQDGCISTAEYNIESDTDEPEFELADYIQLDCNTSEYLGFLTFTEEPTEYIFTGDWFNPIDQSININEPGNYEMTIVGGNGCTNTKSLLVEVDDQEPQFEIIDPGVLDCNNPELNLTAQLPDNYASIMWSGPNLDSENESIDITEAGDYTLTVSAANGCSSQKIITVDADFAEPELSFNATDITCAEVTALISVSSNLNLASIEYYLDSDLIGTGDVFETDILMPIEIRITADNGCTSSQLVTLNEDINSFVFDIVSDNLDCNNTPVTLEVIQQLDISNSILFDSQGNVIGDINTEIIEEGVYTLDLTLADGCQASSDIEIFLDDALVEFGLTADEINCDQEPVTINLTSNDIYVDSQVFDENNNLLGDINSEINSPGTYEVSLTGENGCIATETIDILLVEDAPQTTNFEIEQLVCEEAVILSTIEVEGGTPPYLIEIDGQNIDASLNEFSIEGAGEHFIKVTDALGCQLESSFEIDAVVPVSTEIIPEIAIILGQNVELELTVNKDINDIESIIWSPSDGLSCDDCLNPTFIGEESQAYSVTVIDINGCEAATEIRVDVQRAIKYYVPNVMRTGSNGSGNNNFTIYSNDDDIEEIISLGIYDRWGNKVFINNNFAPNKSDLGWDGTYKNGYVMQGVYVYNALLKLRDGTEERVSGDLTVVK